MPNNDEFNPGFIGNSTQAVRVVDQFEDVASDEISVSGTTTLEALIDGGSLNARVAGVTLLVDPAGTKVHYNPNGVATGTNGPFYPGGTYTVYGNKAKLQQLQLFSSSATNVSVIQHALIVDTVQ